MNTGNALRIPCGLLLAIVWALLAILVWSFAVINHPQVSNISSPTVLLAGFGLVAANLALQRLTSSYPRASTPCVGDKSTSKLNELEETLAPWLTWCFGCAAALHWLGFLVIQVHSIVGSIVLVLLVIIFEIWLVTEFLLRRTDWRSRLIGWYVQLIDRSRNLRDGSTNNYQASVLPEETQVAAADSDVPDCSECDDQTNECTPTVCGNELRATSLGIDPEGRTFHAGWVKLTLSAGQKTETVIIGFCPAIVGEVEIELECEPMEFDATVAQQTPSGMRVEIRRSNAADAVDAILHWQCSAVSLEPRSESWLASQNAQRIVLP